MITAANESGLSGLSLALTLIFGALAFIGVIAAAIVVVRSAGIRENLELLRGEVADLTAAKARVEGERDQMAREVETLRSLATTWPDLEALIVELRTMVRAIEAGWNRSVVEHGSAQPPEQR